MTTMIRPVGIQYADFRHGRITLLVISEIILNVFKITERHGKIQGGIKLLKLCLRHGHKTIKNSNIRRLSKFRL